MLAIISIMIIGIVIGRLTRRCPISWVGRLITTMIWLLLFLLGIEVGGNDQIVGNIASLGVEAIFISGLAVIGSSVAAWSLWKYTRKSEQYTANQDDMVNSEDNGEVEENGSPLKGSCIIVSFFVLGILLGLFWKIDINNLGIELSYWVLMILMFSVGLSLGYDRSMLDSIRKIDKKLLLLPLATILGTYAGCTLVSICLQGRSMADCFAIGSGFAYYSLSSIFITEYRGAELGTLALLTNISREILTLLCAPFLMRIFGPLSPISAGGATTMDTTLPVITQVCGSRYVMLSIFHGFVVDFSVPFLVTLFCCI